VSCTDIAQLFSFFRSETPSREREPPAGVVAGAGGYEAVACAAFWTRRPPRTDRVPVDSSTRPEGIPLLTLHRGQDHTPEREEVPHMLLPPW